MVTIREIAKAADVSASTVSRILNSDSQLKVSTNTRQRVLTIASQLNYQKQPIKIDESSGTIAITSWYKKELTLPSLYLRSVRWGLETTLKNAGYKITRSFFNEELPNTDTSDGIIAIGFFDENSLNSLKNLNKPLVVLNQDTLQYGISCVTTDYLHPVQDIIQHFLYEGHQRIGMIEGQSHDESASHSVDPRSSAFRQVMIQKGLLQEEDIFMGDFSVQSGYKAMKRAIQTLKEELPSAFFISSDTMAIGALRALSEENISVPERVSLIGFGDTELSQFTIPSLSTVQLSPRQIGTIGALTLLNIINGTQTEPIHTVTKANLIFRESSLHSSPKQE